MSEYRPTVSPALAETIRRWHESAYNGLKQSDVRNYEYLGRSFVVPEDVLPPTPMTNVVEAVLREVKPDDRVLDMGTGSGVNAILAASVARDVVGGDINPNAVACAITNAKTNGVEERTSFVVSDLFEKVEGKFDLVIFDPPYRWFKPRDFLEASMTDENYDTLRRFMAEVGSRLTSDGRIALYFGTSGDIDYLYRLIDESGFQKRILGEQRHEKEGVEVTYYAFLLTRGATLSR